MDTAPSAANTTNKSNENAIKLLTNGLLNLYEPQLDVVHKSLTELIDKQNKIENDLCKEISNFSDKNLNETQSMINEYTIYKDKLQMIKKQMVSIHHKANNLKKRALFIQEYKKKELAQKIAKRQYEEGLIGGGRSSLQSSTANPTASNEKTE